MKIIGAGLPRTATTNTIRKLSPLTPSHDARGANGPSAWVIPSRAQGNPP